MTEPICTNLRLQPKSLMRICMRTLKANPRYINNTILPLELVERLHNFILHNNSNCCKYTDYIVTSINNISAIFDQQGSIVINPRRTKLYHNNMHKYELLTKLHAFIFDLNNEYCRDLVQQYNILLTNQVGSIYKDTPYAIKMANINPIILKQLLEKNRGIVITNVPKHYLGRY